MYYTIKRVTKTSILIDYSRLPIGYSSIHNIREPRRMTISHNNNINKCDVNELNLNTS